MLTTLYYCLKVIFCSGVLLGYYWLALRNNRFHQWNRYYLLLSVVLSFVLPLMKIPIPFFSTAEETPLLIRGVEMVGLSDLYITNLQQRHSFHITWQLAVTALYVLVALFLVFVFVKNVISIQKLKQQYPCEFIDGIQFYNTQEQGTPFSFFKNIFWNKRIELNSEKGQQMLAHELAHITEKHSADKVFMEAAVVLAWWNPVLYFIRRELSVIHEFIADKKASDGDENLQYASLLLMKAMGSEQFALGNPFFHSQLKRRLTMLTTSKNPKFSYVRRLMVLPLAAMALVLFSFKYKEFQPQDLIKTPEQTNALDSKHDGKKTVTANKKNDGIVELTEIPVQAFYEDSVKVKLVEKKISGSEKACEYKGSVIETFTPTSDKKGYVIKTKNQNVYFLTKAEATTTFGDKVVQSLEKANAAFERATATKPVTPVHVTIETSKPNTDPAKEPLYIVDGVTKDKNVLTDLKPEDIQSVDVLKGESATTLYGEKGKNGVIKITTKQHDKNNHEVIVQGNKVDEGQKEKPVAAAGKEITVTGYKTQNSDVEKTFTKVEEPADFPGGLDGWRKYLIINLKYPEKALRNGTQGSVKVQLTVNADGSLKDVKALNNPGDGLAEEAERILKKGPKWIPAKQNDQTVTYQFIQTITFKLQ